MRLTSSVAFVAAFLLSAACGGTTSIATHDSGVASAHDGGAAAPASGSITSTLGSSATSTGCNVGAPNTPFLTAGSSSVPVESGVTCSVHPTGTGSFDVNVEIAQGETSSITIAATLTDTPSAQGGVSASFSTGTSVEYTESDCTITLSSQGNPPIAPGRVWGTLSCPTVTDAKTYATCVATATFLFQNCGE